MPIHFHGLPSQPVTILRAGGEDAYGLSPERATSSGVGVPCRHCLKTVPVGQEYLVLAHRPFSALNPYAETGPIFLCASPCVAAVPTSDVPEILFSPSYLIRGYSADARIVYGTGQVTPTPQIKERAEELLNRPDIAFVDVRSASNNCFLCRIKRA